MLEKKDVKPVALIHNRLAALDIRSAAFNNCYAELQKEKNIFLRSVANSGYLLVYSMNLIKLFFYF